MTATIGLLILCALPVAGLVLVAWACWVRREQRRVLARYKQCYHCEGTGIGNSHDDMPQWPEPCSFCLGTGLASSYAEAELRWLKDKGDAP